MKNPKKYRYNNVQFEYIFSSEEVARASENEIVKQLGKNTPIYYVNDAGKLELLK